MAYISPSAKLLAVISRSTLLLPISPSQAQLVEHIVRGVRVRGAIADLDSFAAAQGSQGGFKDVVLRETSGVTLARRLRRE